MARSTDQPPIPPLPHLRPAGRTRQLFVEGEPLILLAGEVHNSSASSLPYMEDQVWNRLTALHCNAAIVPVYWELLEPHVGDFDFSLVDGLLQGARRRKLRLVLLWFGTWKNAMSTYAPAWMKTNPERFFRAQLAPGTAGTPGTPGKPCGAISAFCDDAAAADSRAFATLMHHLRDVDSSHHTVVAVQVQNECGLLGASRDHCPAAEKAFAARVPSALLEYLQARQDTLVPELHELWAATNFTATGTWTDLFGAGADEVFMAWHVARYVEQVAAAGKQEYPLPLFANAWLVQHEGQAPGGYPSGGPVSRMLDIWQAAAPHLDLLAPDIYLDNFAAACAQYVQNGNPLLIPEASRDERAAANVFYALGEHSAICFAPFGMESVPADSPIGQSYALLADVLPVIASHAGSDRMIGVLQQSQATQERYLGDYRLRITFPAPLEKGRAPGAIPGGALILALAPDEFLVAGVNVRIDFLPKPGNPPHVDFLCLDEGTFKRGQWQAGRRLNGDEYALTIGAVPGIRRARLYSFA